MKQIWRRSRVRALAWVALLATAGLSACSEPYHGPSEAEVQAAVKASLERFDEPVKNRMAPHLARLTQSDFAERLHRVRFLGEDKCQPRNKEADKADPQALGETIYECPVSITMRMSRDPLSDTTGLPDTRFEGRLPLVRRDDRWSLTDDSIARQMIVSHVMNAGGMGQPFR